MKNQGETTKKYESDKAYAQETNAGTKHDKAGVL